VDPQVVAEFNCLQQTGNFCPSTSTGSAEMSSSTNSSSGSSSTSSPTMNSASQSPSSVSAHPASIQTAVDAFFAVMGTPQGELGLLGLGVPFNVV
jgi:hypothetical protein